MRTSIFFLAALAVAPAVCAPTVALARSPGGVVSCARCNAPAPRPVPPPWPGYRYIQPSNGGGAGTSGSGIPQVHTVRKRELPTRAAGYFPVW